MFLEAIGKDTVDWSSNGSSFQTSGAVMNGWAARQQSQSLQISVTMLQTLNVTGYLVILKYSIAAAQAAVLHRLEWQLGCSAPATAAQRPLDGTCLSQYVETRRQLMWVIWHFNVAIDVGDTVTGCTESGPTWTSSVGMWRRRREWAHWI